MASGGITGEPVLTARLGSYAGSTGGGKRSNTVTQRNVEGGGSRTQRKSIPNIKQGNAERQLNNLVIKSRNDPEYRNVQGAGMNYGTAYDLAPKAAKDFVDRQLQKTGGRLNEAAKARLNSYLTDRTQYQLDLDKFRKASPENEAAYVKRFPKTAAFERILRQGAEGIVGTPGRIIKNLTDNYLDGVKNMVEKISGVDAKNIDIAKNKDTDIDTIVKNLQRNVEKKVDEEKDREIRTGLPGDLTEEIPVDDIVNAELIEVEEDSPLNRPGTFVPPEDRVPTPIRQTRTEAPGDETAADTQGLTPIRLDRTLADDENLSLFDLAGSDEPGKVSPFALDTEPGEKKYFDLDTNRALDPSDIEIEQEDAAFNLFSPGILDRLTSDETNQLLSDQYRGQKEFRNTGIGFPDIDVTQEQPSTLFNTPAEGERDLTRNPVPGQAVINGVGLVYADGSPFMDRTAQGTALTGERNPTPLFDSDIDEEAVLRAIEGKANGGEIFGNKNMSTFDKLKAIADGIADNK